MIATHPVESSMISELGHDAQASVLHVKFKNGVVWEYDQVSMEEYQKLKGAPSIGKHFIRNIKNSRTADNGLARKIIA